MLKSKENEDGQIYVIFYERCVLGEDMWLFPIRN